MKLFQTSALEAVVQWHRVIPWIGNHYGRREQDNREAGRPNNNQDMLEHYWTGPILLVFSKLGWNVHWGLGVGCVLLFVFLHIILEEVILDAPKRVNENEKMAFRADITLRTLGFVEWVWILWL